MSSQRSSRRLREKLRNRDSIDLIDTVGVANDSFAVRVPRPCKGNVVRGASRTIKALLLPVVQEYVHTVLKRREGDVRGGTRLSVGG